MNYEIEVRDTPPIRVAYMRYQGIATEANKVFPKVFQSVRGKTNGAPFFNYLSMNPETKDLLIKVKQEMDKNKESEKDIGNQTTRHL